MANQGLQIGRPLLETLGNPHLTSLSLLYSVLISLPVFPDEES